MNVKTEAEYHLIDMWYYTQHSGSWHITMMKCFGAGELCVKIGDYASAEMYYTAGTVARGRREQ